jgi:negative regulator of sigma E activity
VNRHELESQLSAMYDGELPAAECELLSRRLVREEPLRAAWSRYAVIGAALRAEPVTRMQRDFARRVSARLDAGAPRAGRRRLRRSLGQWAMGAGVAAGVAGVAILLLRQDLLSGQRPAVAATMAASVAATRPALRHRVGAPAIAEPAAAGFAALTPRMGGEPASYVVPPASTTADLAVPASLADYVVAHSEVSSPLMRRSLLSALVATESLEPAVLPPQAGPVVRSAGPVADRRDTRAYGGR